MLVVSLHHGLAQQQALLQGLPAALLDACGSGSAGALRTASTATVGRAPALRSLRGRVPEQSSLYQDIIDAAAIAAATAP